MKKGFGLSILLILILLSGCAGTKDTEPEFEGVRVLMRYDFGIQEYASVDSAQREMERWVEAYNTDSPEDYYTGTMVFAEIEETEEGYRGYLDCGDIGHFAGVHVYSPGDGTAWEPENPVTVWDTATGEEAALDGAYLAGLPVSYQMVYGPVQSLLMGSDQIVIEVNGAVRYVSTGWVQEGSRVAAAPVELYEGEEGQFAIVYEPEGEGSGKAGKQSSWVVILVVGVLGIAGVLALSKFQEGAG